MSILNYTGGNLEADIQLPSSKSLSNRALLIQALCEQPFPIHSLSTAHDTKLLQSHLLQIKVTDTLCLLDCEDAGTPFRFLLAYACLQEDKTFFLTGTSRLLERPIQALVDALRFLGADIAFQPFEGRNGYLIQGKKITGGDLKISGGISSQFISALCLVAPCLENGLRITIDDQILSESYISMTLSMMKYFGITSRFEQQQIIIDAQPYCAREINIESDWSSATFFYAMSMLMPSVKIKLNGLQKNSLQGDARIVSLAEDFGIETVFHADACLLQRTKEIDPHHNQQYDLRDVPDLAVPFLVACAMQYPKVTLCALDHLEWKESKRLSALQHELAKAGFHFTYQDNTLSFSPSVSANTHSPVLIETYNDHRILMAMSMLCLRGYTLQINDIHCVKKSFPNFFTEIKKAGFQRSESLPVSI